MITFITSHPHTYTVAALRERILSPVTPATRAITYDDLFAADALEPGTYVFTDLERLHPAELRLAARYFRQLGTMPGFRVLNDPARVKIRYALLRALAEAGLNDFDTYCADGLPRPRRFPVFLRIASDHSGPLGDLIHDQSALDARLRALEAEGIPLAGMLVVEFCGERAAHGFYEKRSFLKIGDRITLSALLIGEHWNVKLAMASLGLVTPEIMHSQLEEIRDDRDAEKLREVFDMAGIDYGRADVGICKGRIQVYEINTNPTIGAVDRYISDEHREAREIFRARLGSMLHDIDVAGDGRAASVKLGTLDRSSRMRREIAQASAAALAAERNGAKAKVVNVLRGSGGFLRGILRR